MLLHFALVLHFAAIITFRGVTSNDAFEELELIGMQLRKMQAVKKYT